MEELSIRISICKELAMPIWFPIKDEMTFYSPINGNMLAVQYLCSWWKG